MRQTSFARRSATRPHTAARGLPRTFAALAAICCGLGAGAARAEDIVSLENLTQAQFREFSRDIGAAISFKPLIPTEALGITGIDLGVAVTGTKLGASDAWSAAARGADVPEYLPLASVRLHKGLPLGFDLGAALATVPSSNIRVLSGELRYALVDGGVVVPAVGVRLGLSKLSGVDQLDARTTSLDISVSKGFLFVTPYAGVGHVWVKTDPNAGALASESFGQGKVYAGVNVNLGLVNLAFEADRTGKVDSVGLKLGFRF